MSQRPPASDVAFSSAVKRFQSERGSRAAYARAEAAGGFETGVDERLESFLADVDTAFLATASADGQPYVQHRGGPKGFIRALDDRTLGFVDFAGNRQYVSTGNLSENDRVCLFLMDYERGRRIKVWGRARVVPLTAELAEQLSDPTYRARPEQCVLIEVSAWDVNCSRHIPRKLDAGEALGLIERLEARIRELERARLRRGSGT